MDYAKYCYIKHVPVASVMLVIYATANRNKRASCFWLPFGHPTDVFGTLSANSACFVTEVCPRRKQEK